jgi:hypothetical protein
LYYNTGISRGQPNKALNQNPAPFFKI